MLLHTDKFALTANNITYGAAGDTIGYWNFFPAADGWGRIPVWGYATVTASKCNELPAGERIYGYLPISTHVIVEPAKIMPATFFDGAAHRRGLPPVYNSYQRVNADQAYFSGHEDEIAIFRPLFSTSFLVDDFLADGDFFGARNAVLTSASSKTALGLAQLLHDHRKDQIKVIGLTSPANTAFVESTGYYDQIVAYADVAKLDAGEPTLQVDFAGDLELLAKIHTHFGDQLKYSCIVGATHWQNLAAGNAISAADKAPLPGAKPVFFFAPDRIVKRTADWGVPALCGASATRSSRMPRHPRPGCVSFEAAVKKISKRSTANSSPAKPIPLKVTFSRFSSRTVAARRSVRQIDHRFGALEVRFREPSSGASTERLLL
ncbi:MAG: DUF2855 family protein [Hyphomonadaceae bacterium JAD_PAG50586_4]|nr:MAG: DUF2855 family protein [Hyphomonadaceae bacterium JAD_PAG50586_4]